MAYDYYAYGLPWPKTRPWNRTVKAVRFPCREGCGRTCCRAGGRCARCAGRAAAAARKAAQAAREAAS